MNGNKKFWDRFAWAYEKAQTTGKESKRFYRTLGDRTAAFLTPNMVALELAMGPAMLTARIGAACARLTATDFSEKMVAQAARKKMEALGFVTYFPWSDESYRTFLNEQGFSIVHSEIILWSDYPESFMVCGKQNEAQHRQYGTDAHVSKIDQGKKGSR